MLYFPKENKAYSFTRIFFLVYFSVSVFFTLESYRYFEVNFLVHFLCQIMLSTNAVLENGPKFGEIFLNKKYISLDPFFMQFCRTKNF